MPDGHRTDTTPVRVLIVDDSLVARSVLERILGAHPGIDVAGSAADADEALEVLRARTVDVILLDIEMPERTGIDALPEILAEGRGAKVLIVSALAEEHGPAAIRALALGACDTMAKPGRRGYAGSFAPLLIDKIVRLAGKEVIADLAPAAAPASRHPPTRPRLIAIGGSTGAIGAITTLLSALDPALDVPVLVTQHLPQQFVPFFCEQLARSSGRRVEVARDGVAPLPGHVYLAPGDRHLGCRLEGMRPLLSLFEGDYPVRYTPSVDALFETVAEVYGADALAVVLSGMGRDGLAGARRLAERGGSVLAQDVGSSVVWGMPGAVVRAQLASAIGDPAALAEACNRAGRP